MKKKTVRILILVFAIILVVHFAGGLRLGNKSDTAYALGDLTIDWGVSTGNPIFVVQNMLPGDVEQREVKVKNNGTTPRFIKIKGVRTGGVGTDPKLETILDLVIKNDGAPMYGFGSPTGVKNVAQFFADSGSGLPLGVVNPGQTTTYTFVVTFPSSAGNEFQLKSVIFDLTIQITRGDNIVINEVYYIVDPNHGLDSPKDRGILGVNGDIVTIIQGNGEGSNNTVNVNINHACNILQNNNTNVNVNVNASSNTGGNNASGNTGGATSIISEAASAIANVVAQGGSNSADCDKKLKQNDEWVELFNPTDHDISLRNWTIRDNSGSVNTINVNKPIKAGGFALLSKSASAWNFWNEEPNATKIELGIQIGNGLENDADHLILKNPDGQEVDRMSWGSDTSGFTPVGTNPVVSSTHSTERLSPGFDTNAVSDWHEQNPPTPGN